VRAVGRSGGTSHAERVFRVQQAFAQLGGGAQGLAELARTSELDDSAVHRILRSGVVHGTFLQVGRGRYRLGPQAAQLGAEALVHAMDDEALHACLDRLRRTADGGLAFLYGLSHFGGVQRQCVEMAVGDSDLSEMGLSPRQLLVVSRSLRVGASGRAILAHLPERLRRRALAEPVPQGVGPGAYRERDKLLASLADIRANGYTVGAQECARGWDSYAAPVLWGGTVLGAVTLMKPMSTALAKSDRWVTAIKTAAAGIGQLVDDTGPEPGGPAANG
jgi:DNA-binding IclR family transcriptional regulator